MLALAHALSRLRPHTKKLARTWHQWSARRKELLLRRRSFASLFHSSLARSVQKWAAASRHASHVLRLLSQSRETSLRRALRRWRSSLLCPRDITRAAWAAQRWQRRSEARAFERLRALLDRQQRMRRAVCRMQLIGITRALKSWCARAAELHLLQGAYTPCLPLLRRFKARATSLA